MKRFQLGIIFIFLQLFYLPMQVKAVVKLSPLNPDRVNDIEKVLKAENTGYGLSYQQRAVWDSLYRIQKYKAMVDEAENLLNKPFPAWNDSLYLIFSKKGIRPEGEKMMIERRRWLPILVWAECLENKNRFSSTIEKVLVELCNQPTWVIPAHDWYLENFKETNPNVDLASATQANELGQALYLLNDKISDDVKQLVVEKLYKRVFNPVLKTVRTLDTRHYWLTVTNNWNSVCLAGVTAAALAVIPDAKLRAEFVAMAEKYGENGIIGYRDDGYCTEGLGYYNYGFGNFALLREAVWRATNGKIDFFNEQKINRIATYGVRTEINNGIYPSIADCGMGATPSPWLLWYCGKNLNLNMINISENDIYFQKEPNLLIDMLVTFTNSTCRGKETGNENVMNIGIRSYFEYAGLLLCRPSSKYSKDGLAVAIKGGTNGESHNHNDVGSYTVVGGDEVLMGDAGGPTAYTNKTFTSERYTLYKAFSSFGHPVPLIDGVEQFESGQAKAVVLDTLFTDKKDMITFDISSAYKVGGLKNVIRTFTYHRKGNGTFQVRDDFKAERAIGYETAITTRSKVIREKNRLTLVGQHYSLEIQVTSNVPFTFEETVISTYGVTPYTRIGIKLNEKLSAGTITVDYKLKKR